MIKESYVCVRICARRACVKYTYCWRLSSNHVANRSWNGRVSHTSLISARTRSVSRQQLELFKYFFNHKLFIAQENFSRDCLLRLLGLRAHSTYLILCFDLIFLIKILNYISRRVLLGRIDRSIELRKHKCQRCALRLMVRRSWQQWHFQSCSLRVCIRFGHGGGIVVANGIQALSFPVLSHVVRNFLVIVIGVIIDNNICPLLLSIS